MSDTERQAANVVTSETLADFAAQKLGLNEAANDAEPEAQPDEQAEQVEQDEPQGKKQNPKLERRFSEITKQREAAREEARREREARESLEARLRELEARNNPQPVADLEEPQPDQYNDMYEYAKALAEYTAERKLQERDRQEQARKAAAAQEAKFTTWAERVNAAKAELPDFEDMVSSSEVKVTEHVRDAIMESEYGPQILYFLAENSDTAQKLGDLSVVSAVREIGKIEARFVREAKEEPKQVNKSKAPAPITPLRGAVSKIDAGIDADGNFHGSYQQWKAARQANKIR